MTAFQVVELPETESYYQLDNDDVLLFRHCIYHSCRGEQQFLFLGSMKT